MKLGGTKELGVTHVESKGDKIIFAEIDLYTLLDKDTLTAGELLASAKQVQLHEIGHALGLGHSKEPYDTMYFETSPDGLEFPLTMRDKNTILALYSKYPSELAHLPRSASYSSTFGSEPSTSASTKSSVDRTPVRLQDEAADLK